MIAEHHRENSERISYAFERVKGLFFALEYLEQDIDPCVDQRSAKFAVFEVLRDQISALEKANAMEWVGVGGHSQSLSDQEVAEARGECSKT